MALGAEQRFFSQKLQGTVTKVLYEKDGRIGRITLNRPEVMNAIDDDLPHELAAAVAEADRACDDSVRRGTRFLRRL